VIRVAEQSRVPTESNVHSLPTQRGFILVPVVSPYMPEIQVSESLYRQLEDACDGRDFDTAMWEMLYRFQRGNDPAE